MRAAATRRWAWVETLALPSGSVQAHATCVPSELAGRTPAVCLHHGTGASSSWLGFAAALAAAEPAGYGVVAYDRAGYGGSSPLPAAELRRDFLLDGVAELVAVLDRLHVQRCCVVGHSDGASIALMAASLYPARVGCVVAEAPHMNGHR